MIKVLEVPAAEDLSGFTEILWQRRVPHRVIERQARQELWVAREVDAEEVRTLYRLWREGADLSGYGLSVRHAEGEFGLAMLRQTWLSLLLIALSVLVTVLIDFGGNHRWMHLFTIVEYRVQGDSVYFSSLVNTVSSGQWWRFFTPALMHFSMPHIVFNLLWVWVVGRNIERRHGRLVLLGLVLLSALVSNFAQFWVSGPLFGGMSGVVFALLAYAWLWDRRGGRPVIGLPPALMGLMLLWLALGFTGVLKSLGFGEIANTAHLAGLLVGLVWVFPVAAIRGRHRQ